MAWETATATGPNDLIDRVRTFCVANGWTVDAYQNDGTGKRLHIWKGTVHVNLRSFVNEARATLAGGGQPINGLLLNLSTGAYNGSAGWFDQAGVPVYTPSDYRMTAGLVKMTGAATYHIFSFGTCVYLWVEAVAGYWEFLGWGTISKDDAFNGGEFFFGTVEGAGDQTWNNPGQGAGGRAGIIGRISESGMQGAASFINADYDGVPGWKFGFGGNTQNPNQAQVFDTLSLIRTSMYNTPNSINSLAIPEPLKAYIFRDTNNGQYSFFSSLGGLPELHFINIKSLNVGQQITLGSDTFRVLPFYAKSDNDPSAYSSGYMGVAIKSN